MSQVWYNNLAKKNGGYKSDASYEVVGESGESIFEDLLKSTVGQCGHVLDMGCGHGEFTLEIAKYCPRITGGDNSGELLKIARQLRGQGGQNNVNFVYASTKEGLPFEAETFDLVYVRRGPTSIVDHSHIIKKGGRLMGVYTCDLDIDAFVSRLEGQGFVDIDYRLYDSAYYKYPSVEDFANHLSSMHCSVDYRLESNKQALDVLVEANTCKGQLTWPQDRYVFVATRP